MTRCPHCGQQWPPDLLIRTADELVAVLRLPVPPHIKLTKHQIKTGQTLHRSVYEGAGGKFHIKYGGCPSVSGTAVYEALRLGMLVPEWADRPDIKYWKLK